MVLAPFAVAGSAYLLLTWCGYDGGMNVSRSIMIVICALLATGCAVTFTPDAPVVREAGVRIDPVRGEVINPYLGLRVYPGSRIISNEVDGRESETEFEVGASLRAVYDYFHEQLVRGGWRRVDLDVESDEIEAVYVRQGVELELELELEGRGRFELEIDVD